MGSDSTRAKRSKAALVHDIEGAWAGKFPSKRSTALGLKTAVSGISRAVNPGVVLR